MRKPFFGVSDQVRHKLGCTATEDGYRLGISDLGSRGIVLSVCSKNKDADQLHTQFFNFSYAAFLVLTSIC